MALIMAEASEHVVVDVAAGGVKVLVMFILLSFTKEHALLASLFVDDGVIHVLHPLYNDGFIGAADPLWLGFIDFVTLSLQDCYNYCSLCTAKVHNIYCLSSKHLSVHKYGYTATSVHEEPVKH